MPMLHNRVQAQLGRLWSSCASTRSMQTQQQHNNSVNNNHSDEEMGEEEFIENVEERSVWLHTDTHLRVDDDASFSSNMLLHVLYVASFYATTLHFTQTNIGKTFWVTSKIEISSNWKKWYGDIEFGNCFNRKVFQLKIYISNNNKCK